MKSSHPIEVDVKNSKEIEGIFDSISYAKGASIIRMLAHTIGFEHFRKIIAGYLNKFKFKNAETLDLWQCFDEYPDNPIKDVSIQDLMSSWTKKTGYPYISASRSGTKLVLSQSRYMRDMSGSEAMPKDNWIVPLHIVNGKSSMVVFLKECKY